MTKIDLRSMKNQRAPWIVPGSAGGCSESAFGVLLLFAGTGSCPQPPHGWQRQTRFVASQLPARAPCVRNASSAYREQLGVNRQPASGPNKKVIVGESIQRYTRTTKIKMC
jgi:hypothetical protein